MNKFKQLLTAIQTFMDTEIELTEQAISHVQRRPRLPYFVGGLFLGLNVGVGVLLSYTFDNLAGLLFLFGFTCFFILSLAFEYRREA